MITVTLRLEDSLIQGERISVEDKPDYWRLCIADFHAGDSCEIIIDDEQMCAIVALSMGVGEENYTGYWPPILYKKIEETMANLKPSLRPCP